MEISIPSASAELNMIVSKRMSAPLPDSDDARLKMLADHLREVTAYLERTSPKPFVTTSEEVSNSIAAASELFATLRTLRTARMSECDAAAAWGVGLITVGAIGGGPVGAIAGFAYGVALLAQSC